MASSTRVTALLVVLGVLALTNSAWLFPHEGDRRYTYERARITVDDGTLSYRGDSLVEHHYRNDMPTIDCQSTDTLDRDCAFDRHLRSDGPVTIDGDDFHGAQPGYTRIADDYYLRVVREDQSSTTYDVRRVGPRELLADAARNVSGISPSVVSGHERTQLRVAITGEQVRTFERLDDDELGRVYLRDGAYYTVVVTGESVRDVPLFSGSDRGPLSFVGLLLLFVALVRVFDHYDVADRFEY